MAFSTQKDFFLIPYMNANMEYQLPTGTAKLKSYDSTVDDRGWAGEEQKRSKFLVDFVTGKTPAGQRRGDLTGTAVGRTDRDTRDRRSDQPAVKDDRGRVGAGPPSKSNYSDGSEDRRNNNKKRDDGQQEESKSSASEARSGTESDDAESDARTKSIIKKYEGKQNGKKADNKRPHSSSSNNRKDDDEESEGSDKKDANPGYASIENKVSKGKGNGDGDNTRNSKDSGKYIDNMQGSPIDDDFENSKDKGNYYERREGDKDASMKSNLRFNSIKQRESNNGKEDDKRVSNKSGRETFSDFNGPRSVSVLNEQKDIFPRWSERTYNNSKYARPVKALKKKIEQLADEGKIDSKDENDLYDICLEIQLDRDNLETNATSALSQSGDQTGYDQMIYVNDIASEMQDMQQYYEKKIENSKLKEEDLKCRCNQLQQEVSAAKSVVKRSKSQQMEVEALRNELHKRDIALNSYEVQYQQLMNTVSTLTKSLDKRKKSVVTETQTDKEPENELLYYTGATLDYIVEEVNKHAEEVRSVISEEPTTEKKDDNIMRRITPNTEERSFDHLDSAKFSDSVSTFHDCITELKRLKDLSKDLQNQLESKVSECEQKREELNRTMEKLEEVQTCLCDAVEQHDRDADEIKSKSMELERMDHSLSNTKQIENECEELRKKVKELEALNKCMCEAEEQSEKVCADLRKRVKELEKLNLCMCDAAEEHGKTLDQIGEKLAELDNDIYKTGEDTHLLENNLRKSIDILKKISVEPSIDADEKQKNLVVDPEAISTSVVEARQAASIKETGPSTSEKRKDGIESGEKSKELDKDKDGYGIGGKTDLEKVEIIRASVKDDDKDGTNKDGSGKDESAKDGSVKDGSAKDGSAKDGSAKDGSAKYGSVKDGSVKDGSAKDGSAKDISAKDISAKVGSVKDISAKVGSVKDGSAKDGSAKVISAKDISAKVGSVKDGSVKDGSVKDGSAKDGSAKDGSGKGGSAKDGSAIDGFAKNEFAKNDSAKNESVKDGSAIIGSTKDGSAKHESEKDESAKDESVKDGLAMEAEDGSGTVLPGISKDEITKDRSGTGIDKSDEDKPIVDPDGGDEDKLGTDTGKDTTVSLNTSKSRIESYQTLRPGVFKDSSGTDQNTFDTDKDVKEVPEGGKGDSAINRASGQITEHGTTKKKESRSKSRIKQFVAADEGDSHIADFIKKSAASMSSDAIDGVQFECDLRKIFDDFIEECGFSLCKCKVPKSRFYAICRKLYHFGLHTLDIRELVYMHKKIYTTAENIMPGCILDIILKDSDQSVKLSALKQCCTCKNNLCCDEPEGKLMVKVMKLEHDIENAKTCLQRLRRVSLSLAPPKNRENIGNAS